VTFPSAAYKDLESSLLRLRFTEDPAHELNLLRNLTILDEAQTVPEIFPALRGAIYERRGDRQCHFCVLSSAQPALIREAPGMASVPQFCRPFLAAPPVWQNTKNPTVFSGGSLIK